MLNRKFMIDLGSPKVRKNLLIALIAVITIIAALLYFGISGVNASEEPFIEDQMPVSDVELESEGSEEQAGSIYVDISGAVKEPSVIILAEGSRVFEAIEAAGGLDEDANLSEINRAEVLEDGAYLYIPTNKELEEQTVSSVNSGVDSSGSSVGAGLPGSTSGKININTADSATLQQLNGVGPATADKIIAYRETSGKFKRIEDLKNVSGIGEKTFEKLAPYIKV